MAFWRLPRSNTADICEVEEEIPDKLAMHARANMRVVG
jgi:hypothetical protein